MTDGIIQEVFDKYWNEFTYTTILHKAYLNLQKELIEKIKEDITKNNDWRNTWYIGTERVYPINLLLKNLVGDNQE